MERSSHNGLPLLIADTKRLRQELEQLYASVKGTSAERRDQTEQATALVIRGK